jgi:hypothetical protein
VRTVSANTRSSLRSVSSTTSTCSFKDFEDRRHPFADLRSPAVDVSKSGKFGVLLPHHIRPNESQEGIDVTPGERIENAPSDLHVLM